MWVRMVKGILDCEHIMAFLEGVCEKSGVGLSRLTDFVIKSCP